eukprot:gene11762-8089_t
MCIVYASQAATAFPLPYDPLSRNEQNVGIAILVAQELLRKQEKRDSGRGGAR